jgi:hypothetical protein
MSRLVIVAGFAGLVLSASAEEREPPGRKGLFYPPEVAERIASEHARKAAAHDGFDAVQTEAVRSMFAEGFADYPEIWEIIDRLAVQNAAAVRRGEMTFGQMQEAQKPLVDRGLASLQRMRAEFREKMLDDAQRAVASAKFTADQRTKADELLAAARAAAADHRKAREAAFRRLAADWAEVEKARQEGRADLDRWQGVKRAGTELTAPLEELGRRWKADVAALLTADQRRLLEQMDRSRR